jgi:hypothetical protein
MTRYVVLQGLYFGLWLSACLIALDLWMWHEPVEPVEWIARTAIHWLFGLGWGWARWHSLRQLRRNQRLAEVSG